MTRYLIFWFLFGGAIASLGALVGLTGLEVLLAGMAGVLMSAVYSLSMALPPSRTSPPRFGGGE